MTSLASDISCFYFCPEYGGKGPRVLILSGSRWTPAMLKHIGVLSEPIYTRARIQQEPETYPNGHPWGWAYKLEDATKDELRLVSQASADALQSAIDAALASHKLNQESELAQAV